MRPIALKGHDRSITSVKFNQEGDLLLTTAKSTNICLWRTETGERIGTYVGHQGAVWSVDIDRKSKYVLSGAADQAIMLWDAETGRMLMKWQHKAPVRCVEFSFGEKSFLAVTDAVLQQKATIFLYEMEKDVRDLQPKPYMEIVSKSEGKIIQASWGPLNKYIIAVGGGAVHLYDPKNGQVIQKLTDHTKDVMCIAWNPTQTLFLTCSKDHDAHLYDADTFERIKTYNTGRPVNACALSPTRHEVILGGGQDAISVTTTRVDSAQFKVKFFNAVFEEEVGAVAGHFGPVNALAYMPDGKGFVSGGEDGFVYIYHFDSEYFSKFNQDDNGENKEKKPAAAQK